MEIDNLKELMSLKFQVIELQVKYTNQRIDNMISTLKWLLGIVVPVLTVVLNAGLTMIIQ